LFFFTQGVVAHLVRE